MKRFLLPLLSLLAIGSLTSCFQSEITLRLNKDGSGTLTEENSFGQQAVEMLAQFSQLGGAGAKDPLADLVSAEKAQARAAKLGEGVTVEKTEAISKNGGKGFGQMAKMLGGGNLDMAKMAQMTGQPTPTPEQMEEMAEKLKGLGGPGGMKLPGLGGGGLPPGFNPFKK